MQFRVIQATRTVVAGARGSVSVVDGTFEDDVLLGDDHANTLREEEGRDGIHGRGRNDRIAGGSGAERLSGGAGADKIHGGSGRDRLDGGSGRDRLSGGPGADRIIGGSGRDRCLSPSTGAGARSCELS